MPLFSSQDIKELEPRFRANFIQSLLGAKSTFLVSTRGSNGIDNLAIFNNLIHIGANPPLYGIQFRPDEEVRRDTLRNIMDTGYYSLNSITENMVSKAHQSSAKYPAEVSEFDVLGFEKEASSFPVSYVSKSPIKITLKYSETLQIKNSGVTILLGEIQEIIVLENPESDGFYDPISAGTITSVGLDAYYSLHEIGRMNYAKTNVPLQWK
jgi:flavin reductase (DIM6/NTAB) family NADH-FMN oxidoreductase RutF